MARKEPTPGAFIAEALLVNTEPTSYLTRFKASALQEISNHINTSSLPLLVAHDSYKLPVGSWFTAEVRDQSVFSKFYIPKEVSEYEDITSRIRTNILDSVSIAFNAGVHECSICHNPIYDYDACPHIPGKEYEIKDETGTTVRKEVCYVLLDDIRPSEGSLVYTGAVPKAKITSYEDKKEFFTKNEFNFTEGKLEVVQHSCTYHICNETNNEGETHMADENYQVKYMEVREELVATKEKLLEFKEKSEKYDQAVKEKEDAANELTTFAEKLQTKVQALAAPFDAEYKAPEDLDTLFNDMDKFIEQAKALPSGQQTVDEDDEVQFEAPSDAYKV